MDSNSVANCLLKTQVVIISDVVRRYVPQRETWPTAVEQIEAAMTIVRDTVHLVDRVPPFLIAIDLFWRPDGSEWPDWRRITRWQDEDLSGHPWSQWPMSVEVGESGMKERRRKREANSKADEVDNDEQRGRSQKRKRVASAAHKTRPLTTPPLSDEDEDSDDTGAAAPVAATTAPPPTARPARAANKAQPVKRPRDPSPSLATSSSSTGCTTCIRTGDICVPNPKNPSGACKGCNRRKRRCSLFKRHSSRIPSRPPAGARSRPQSTAPPPNQPIIVVKSLRRSDSPQPAAALPPKMLKIGPLRAAKLEVVDSSAPRALRPRTKPSVAGPSCRSRSQGKPSQQRHPASRAIMHPPTRPTVRTATPLISREEHERLLREAHERHREADQGREYKEVIARIDALEQRLTSMRRSMEALRLQAAGGPPAIGDGVVNPLCTTRGHPHRLRH